MAVVPSDRCAPHRLGINVLYGKLNRNVSHKQKCDSVPPDIDYINGCQGLRIAPE
jgi:hypothetical protein